MTDILADAGRAAYVHVEAAAMRRAFPRSRLELAGVTHVLLIIESRTYVHTAAALIRGT